MKRLLLFLLAAAAGSLCADVTVRYKSEIKSPFMQAMPGEMQAQLQSMMPSSTSTRVKGNKGISEMGWMSAIMDLSAHQIVLLNNTGKKYAISADDQYTKSVTQSVPEVPEAARAALASPKTKTETNVTGRTATIQGIEAEEREIVTTIDGPTMPGMPPISIRMVMQVWMAKASEVDRVPALKELAAYTSANYSTFNPMGTLQKMLAMLPGAGDSMTSLIAEMTRKDSVMMRMHIEMFMPMLAELAKMAPAGASPLPEFDANAPLFQINQEVTELSTAPVTDSVFQVPADYEKQPIDEFMKSLLAKFVPAAK